MATDLLTIGTAAQPTRSVGEGNSTAALPAGPPQLSVSTPPATDPSEDQTGTQSPASSTAVTTSLASDYVQLTKPRIVVMILVTTAATAIIGGGGLLNLTTAFWLMLGTAAIAASAGAANQVWERVIDARMTRTSRRPLPDGRIGPWSASLFTLALGILGTTVLASAFGTVPALAGVVTWLLYVVVYTPMKTRTSWNTTVGAVAGALPVLIGYTALGGSLSDWTAWLLVGVLAAWQYPHFMAIAWMYRQQYDAAGFKMTTTVEPTGRAAAMQSIVGTLALIGCGVALCVIPGNGWLAWLASMAVTAACLPMLRASVGFARQPGDAPARRLLRSSLLVLPAVLLVVTLRVFW